MSDVPEFKSIFVEHIEGYRKVIPYLLFGEFADFINIAFIQSAEKSEKTQYYLRVFHKSIKFLDKAIVFRNSQSHDLILNCANDLRSLDQYMKIRPHLGINLTKHLKEIDYYE